MFKELDKEIEVAYEKIATVYDDISIQLDTLIQKAIDELNTHPKLHFQFYGGNELSLHIVSRITGNLRYDVWGRSEPLAINLSNAPWTNTDRLNIKFDKILESLTQIQKYIIDSLYHLNLSHTARYDAVADRRVVVQENGKFVIKPYSS